jgi:hypothetical protein
LNPDFLDLLTAFNAADVRYMVDKRAAARPQDLADIDALERLHRVRIG